MSLQDIALPVDVPWQLIATSPDMRATHANRFPNAMWKSSLAIFAYDPLSAPFGQERTLNNTMPATQGDALSGNDGSPKDYGCVVTH